MDVLEINEAVIENYTNYITSFTDIKDKRIKETISNAIKNNKLWKEPLIQFNPDYEIGESIEELCSQKVLEPELNYVFKGFRLYKHQTEALIKGSNEESFVVTSGTGSGKSVTFIGTIYNYLFKEFKKGNVKGIKAIIVYPMNALINSQNEELEKHATNYKINSGKEFPFRFSVYTGQENEEERNNIKNNPPDILLTNYMMLELILTRNAEKPLVAAISENLKILAFDELHVYRGRQGSDVALLIRRIKALAQKKLVLIGTSATMASNKNKAENISVEDAVTKIFGKKFYKENIINEKIKSSLLKPGEVINIEELKNYLLKNIDEEADIQNNILAKWIEANAAIEFKDGVFARRKPLNIKEIVNNLSKETNIDTATCLQKIKNILLKINVYNSQTKDKKILPFKVHQFISQSGAVKVTLEAPEKRYITIDDEIFYYENENELNLFQVVFNYYSGEAFICVIKDDLHKKLYPIDFSKLTTDSENKNINSGYIFFTDEEIDLTELVNFIPETWKNKNGLKEQYIERLPNIIYFDKYGNFYDKDDDGTKLKGYFTQAPLFWEPFTGILYNSQERDYNKFTSIGIEGRSTATNILILELLNELRKNGIKIEEQKVLSFIDNRQDASLQAGHFNDFINKLKIRTALYQALKNADIDYFDHSNIAYKVFTYLNFELQDYSNKSTDSKFQVLNIENSFRNLLFYSIILDLKYEWRIILPDLEKTGLIKIDYPYLKEHIFDDNKTEKWDKLEFFCHFTKEELYEFIVQTLNFIRTNFAINHNLLEESALIKNFNDIRENIKEEWINDIDEHNLFPNYIYVKKANNDNKLRKVIKSSGLISAGTNSNYGKFIKKNIRDKNLSYKDINELILDIFNHLSYAGYLKKIEIEGTQLFRLDLSHLIWVLNKDGEIMADNVRKRSIKEYPLLGNKYFKSLYDSDYNFIKSLNSKEHTAQICNEDRKEREEQFRRGKINLLCCSPTMELGIDIASLNFVHLRNVPPSPANYAQRAGRAGRSGQSALIYTFCGKYSEHDQHFFRNPTDMVAGIVEPPKIELCNEDLLLTHLHAIAFSKLSLDIGNSITSIIDISDFEELKLRDNINYALNEIKNVKDEIIKTFKETIKDFEDDLNLKAWYNENWIVNNVNNILDDFDKSFNRWRNLFKNAQINIAKATDIINNPIYSKNSDDNKKADIILMNARMQRYILMNESTVSKNSFSEFYPYRYLAAEGFLPGYNFTKLPIRAFFPAGESSGLISRPRFLALRELGPQNLVYHNSKKYRINQLLTNDLANKKPITFKIEENTGYAIFGDYSKNEFSPFSREKITFNKNYTNLMPFADVRAVLSSSITCVEEERNRQGYLINTYFTFTGDIDKISTLIVKSNNEELIKIKYLPTTNIIKVNEGYKDNNGNYEGFYVNKNNGIFVSKAVVEKKINIIKDNKNEYNKDELLLVKFYTEIVADAIYIFPAKALNFEPQKEKDAIITFQYALKKAIEKYFSIESNELEVISMGNSNFPNILIYEAAEGSLGILSQINTKKDVFFDLIKTAYEICHFKDGIDTRPDIKKASYEDLLSYSNQMYHKILDRHLIKHQLEMLLKCDLEIVDNAKFNNIDEQFSYLLSKYDKNSSTEKDFLDYLYLNNFKLPDEAQPEIEGLYIRPDFYYKDTNTLVFCDGTPHDDPNIKEDDMKKREALAKRGYNIFVYYYKDNLDEIINNRKDIFKKVK